MKKRTGQQIAMRVSSITMVGNILLSGFKLLAGIVSKSGAMVSDAIHSASDVFSTIVVMIGVKMAGREADREHPYGHERMECVAAIVLSVLLLGTGLGIGWAGARKMLRPAVLAVPGRLALTAAVVSILVKEGMYWYTRKAANQIQSGALMADAWHHRSDALSSVGSFLGILGARNGIPLLDPAASVVICIFIAKAALSIFADAVNKMTDRACGQDMVGEIDQEVRKQEGVLGVDQLNTRLFGNRVYVDVEIQADGKETLEHAHQTAQRVHDAIERRFPEVKHCMVHVNPAEREKLELAALGIGQDKEGK